MASNSPSTSWLRCSHSASSPGAGMISPASMIEVEEDVTLPRHCQGVRLFAAKFANAVGLPDPMSQDLGLAALLHDAGKHPEP